MLKKALAVAAIFSAGVVLDSEANAWTVNGNDLALVFEFNGARTATSFEYCFDKDFYQIRIFDLNMEYIPEKTISFRTRVDEGKIRTFDRVDISESEAEGSAYSFKIDAQMYKEMVRGQMLRVQYMGRDGYQGGIVEEYSLVGFTQAHIDSGNSCHLLKRGEDYFLDNSGQSYFEGEGV